MTFYIQQDELTFEEKMIVADKMTELGDKISEDFEKHNSFLIESIKTLLVPFMIIFISIASVLGIKTKIKKS